MRRRLLNLLTTLSLLACVAAAVFWWRGYRVTDGLYLRWPGGPLVALDSRGGELSVVVQHRHAWQLRGFRYWRGPRVNYPVRAQLRDQDPEPRDRVRFLGFTVRKSRRGDWWVVTVPTWSVAAATLVLPAADVARRVRKRRRAAGGTCAACGYDLRATPDRCPECGTAAAVSTKAWSAACSTS